MRMRSRFLVLASVLMAIAPSIALQAQAAPAARQPATGGEVQYVSGEVHVGEAKAIVNQAVQDGQTVRTGADSTAIIAFADGSRIKLNPMTRLKLDSLKSGTELALESGAVFSQVRKQKTPGKFIIRTKTAVMGVRGTRFFTAYGKAEGKGADVWMCVDEGAVEVESSGGGKAGKVVVQEGQGVFVPFGKAVTPPRPYEWTRKLNWSMEPEKGDIIDRTKIEYKDLLKRYYD